MIKGMLEEAKMIPSGLAAVTALKRSCGFCETAVSDHRDLGRRDSALRRISELSDQRYRRLLANNSVVDMYRFCVEGGGLGSREIRLRPDRTPRAGIVAGSSGEASSFSRMNLEL